MKNTKTENEAKAGVRGTAPLVASVNVRAARRWLMERGSGKGAARELDRATLRVIYNDTTDAALSQFIEGQSATAVQSAATGCDAEALRALREIIGGGTNEPRVREIAVEVAADIAETEADEVRQEVSEITSALLATVQPILDAIAAAGGAVAAAKPIALAVEVGNDAILSKVARFYPPSGECVPVVICSPPSFGKSRAIRALGKGYDLCIIHTCSPSISEMETMSGEVRVDSEGKWVTLDGPLTQAIRAAASGQRVLFAFDEVFRLSDKAEQGLMGILQPHDGVYEWRTCHGKDGAFEVLRAPVENLHFIAAGNLNGKTPSEAFWTRWEPVRIEFSEKLAVSTAESVLAKHGIADARLAKMFASAMATSRSLAKSGATNYALSFRTLERAAKFSGGSAKVTAAALAERISDTVSAWCPDSGDVVDASAKTAAALAAMFSEFSAE